MNKLIILTANGIGATEFLISKSDSVEYKDFSRVLFPETKRISTAMYNHVAIPLAECEFETKTKEIFQTLESYNVCVCTHSDLLLAHLRLEASTRNSNIENIKIIFYNLVSSNATETSITMTKSFGLSSWPKGFFDGTQRVLGALVQAGINARKKQ